MGEDLRAPLAEAGPGATIDCGAPTVPLSGSATGGNGSMGYGFRWEPAGDVTDPDSPDTQALQPGTYTLIVTDLANGCANVDFVVVDRDRNVPIADAGPDAILACGGAARLRPRPSTSPRLPDCLPSSGRAQVARSPGSPPSGRGGVGRCRGACCCCRRLSRWVHTSRAAADPRPKGGDRRERATWAEAANRRQSGRRCENSPGTAVNRIALIQPPTS